MVQPNDLYHPQRHFRNVMFESSIRCDEHDRHIVIYDSTIRYQQYSVL